MAGEGIYCVHVTISKMTQCKITFFPLASKKTLVESLNTTSQPTSQRW